MRSLDGCAAVVTGATSGVGLAVANALAREGARLALVGRNPAALDAVVDTLNAASGGRASGYRADLTVDADLCALRRRVERELGQVDLLVHAAGVIEPATVEESSAEQFDRQYRTNLRAPYLLTQQLLPLLRARRGQVVFVNSTAVLRAAPGAGQYAATKHGLRGLADALRAEVNGDGVRVLTVLLGRTATPMQQALQARTGQTYTPERLLQPDDLAAVLISLMKIPDSAEVTELVVRPMAKA